MLYLLIAVSCVQISLPNLIPVIVVNRLRHSTPIGDEQWDETFKLEPTNANIPTFPAPATLRYQFAKICLEKSFSW